MGGLFTLNTEKINADTTAVDSASSRLSSGSCSTQGLPRPMNTLPTNFDWSDVSEPFSRSRNSVHTPAAILTATGKSMRINARETLRRRRADCSPPIFARPSRRNGRASGTSVGHACSIALTARIHGSFGIASSEPRKASPPSSSPSFISTVARSSAAFERRPFAPASASSASERSSGPSDGGCGATASGSGSGSAAGAGAPAAGSGFGAFTGFAGFSGSSEIPRSFASMIARFTGVGRFLEASSFRGSLVSSDILFVLVKLGARMNGVVSSGGEEIPLPLLFCMPQHVLCRWLLRRCYLRFFGAGCITAFGGGVGFCVSLIRGKCDDANDREHVHHDEDGDLSTTGRGPAFSQRGHRRGRYRANM